MQFKTSAPFDTSVLEHLRQVLDIEIDGEQVTVLGEGELLQVVSEALVRGGGGRDRYGWSCVTPRDWWCPWGCPY